MAHKGIANLSTSVLRDEIKAKFGGTSSYEPITGEYWVYKTATAPTSPSAVFTTADDFIQNAGAVAVDDEVKWIAIKNLGYTEIAKTNKTAQGIMINWAGANPLFNGVDGTDSNNIIIGPGEMFVARLKGVLVEDLRVGSIITSATGQSSAIGTDTVAYITAAVIKDV